jgi:hypothetical protein
LEHLSAIRFHPLTPISGVSSAFTEQWAEKRHRPDGPVVTRPTGPPYIQYADLSDLMLMLDMMVGGVMEAVIDGQQLIRRKVQK